MEGAVAKNTIIRLKSALVSMGYRKQGNICWSKSGFAFDDETTNEDFVYSIAITEQGLHIKESSDVGESRGKVYNFSKFEDLYNMDL